MDSNIVLTQFTAAGVAVWGIQQLKAAPWFPLLKHNGQVWAKRITSILAAIGIHTGISAVWNHNTPPIGYAYQLVINIPPVTIIIVTVWHWVGQYVMQEGWYQVAYNRVTLTSSPEGPTTPMRVTADGAVVVPKSGN
jgi:hypothetical protein